MDVFDELLSGLGSVPPGVLEVGLVNPEGTITYSSKASSLDQKHNQVSINGLRDEVRIEKRK